MKTYAVYMKPKGSLAGPIGSDTLFGALCWSIRTLNGRNGTAKLEQILLSFNKHPSFIVSSTFPYIYRDVKKIRFFPKPLLPCLSSAHVDRLASESKDVKRDPQDSLARKRAVVGIKEKEKPMKSVRYVSGSMFEEIVSGAAGTITLLQRLVDLGVKDKDIELVGDAFITKGERALIDQDAERRWFWSEFDVQRNEIDRLIGSTVKGRLFFIKETLFARDIAGLWFILRTDNLEFVKPLLRFMEDTGIGGDRSVGKGQFTIPLDEIEEIDIPDAGKDANCFVSLSRYLPVSEECDFGQGPLSYALTTIRPKHESRLPGLGHRLYKKMLRIFEPGSILPIKTRKETGYYGQIALVGTNAEDGGWNVWHNGMTIPAFAKIRGEE